MFHIEYNTVQVKFCIMSGKMIIEAFDTYQEAKDHLDCIRYEMDTAFGDIGCEFDGVGV